MYISISYLAYAQTILGNKAVINHNLKTMSQCLHRSIEYENQQPLCLNIIKKIQTKWKRVRKDGGNNFVHIQTTRRRHLFGRSRCSSLCKRM